MIGGGGGGTERCVDGGNWDLGVDGGLFLGRCDGDDVPWHSYAVLSFEVSKLSHALRKLLSTLVLHLHTPSVRSNASERAKRKSKKIYDRKYI